MHGEIGIVAVRTATILHVSSPSFFSRYMQYTVSIAQNPASVKGEHRFSARQCQRHRPPAAPPIPATSSFFARRPLLPAGEKQDAADGNLHKCLPVRSEPAFSVLFSRSRVAFCPRLMQVFREAFLQKGRHPRGSALPPARTRAPAVSREPPGSAICLSPSAPKAAALCTPRARACPAHRLSPPAVSAAPPVPAADTAPAWAPCGANTAGSLRRKAA